MALGLSRAMAFLVSAVVSIKRQMVSLRRPRSGVRSGLDQTPSCSRQPGSPSPPPCQLHQATRLRSHPSHFASAAPFTPPPPQSIKMRRRIPAPPAQACVFPQTEQSSDHFINWAPRIILRHRSFLLSINKHQTIGKFSQLLYLPRSF
jgi:hypothetical protein